MNAHKTFHIVLGFMLGFATVHNVVHDGYVWLSMVMGTLAVLNILCAAVGTKSQRGTPDEW